MHNEADDPQHREVVLSGKWYRLIPSRFPTIELYERVATPAQGLILKEIEMLTNPRKLQRDSLAPNPGAAHGSSPRFQNWNHAPFAYPNRAGSRYLDPTNFALEVYDSLDAALAVSIRLRETFLAATDQPRIAIDMRVLRHQFSGTFADRTMDPPDFPQQARWEIGARLLEAEKHGVSFTCPDLPRCRGVSIFTPSVLQQATQAEHYRFLWDGSKISAIYLCTLEGDDDQAAVLPQDILAKPPV